MPDAQPAQRPIASIADVCDVALVRGAAEADEAAPSLLVEIPHGATRAVHFATLRARLRGPFPDDLDAFFFVNTDVGAPEVAVRLAERIVAAAPHATALVVRCLIPRTFIDCNRVIDAATRPAASAAGSMTPGVASYVHDAADFGVLFERYSAYRDVATRAHELVCGTGGTAVQMHSYAPRSIDVPVDEKIVERLRAAYEPGVVGTWPLRAEVDLISRTPDGTRVADGALVARIQASLDRAGIRHAESEAYALHPSTLGAVFAARWPRRTICIEMRRDLLVREFTPFQEMEIDPAKADRMAAAFAEALLPSLANVPAG